MTGAQQLTDSQTADALIRGLEYVGGPRGIWKTRFNEEELAAVQTVQRALARMRLIERDLPDVNPG